jgi:hypothetical protein
MSWRDQKRNPDENCAPDAYDQPWKPTGDPADLPFSLERIDEMEIESDEEDAEKSAPDVVGELDHARSKQDMPSDHPGESVGEHLKGLPAQWGKASP